jgi:hypothetical protein
VVETDKINNDAVTGAKIADNAINSEHYTDGSIDTVHIADNQVTLAKMAGGTDGNLITYDASGDPAYVVTGSDGQVLTSAGAGAAPTFEALPASGKVLQVVQNHTNTSTSVTNSTTLTVATDLTVAITPSASSSKILVMMNCGGMSSGVTNAILLSMFRDSTAIVERARQGYNSGTGTNAWTSVPFVMSYMDSPSTTSEITYSFKFGTGAASGTSLQINPGAGSSTEGVVIAMEIAG